MVLVLTGTTTIYVNMTEHEMHERNNEVLGMGGVRQGGCCRGRQSIINILTMKQQ